MSAELRQCNYCQTWRNKPCGDGCYWSPSDPTQAQLATAPASPANTAAATGEREAAIPELRQIVEIDHTSDMEVRLRFTSCRAASSFFQQVKNARWPDHLNGEKP
jgi:hypothetical protein